VGIQLKEVEKFEAHRTCMISVECPAVLAPESAQPWPIFTQPRQKLVAGSQAGSTAVGSLSSVATVAGNRAWFVEPSFRSLTLSLKLSLSLCHGVAGRRRRLRGCLAGDTSLSVALSLSYVRRAGAKNPPVRDEEGFGPPFFVSLSLAQSTKIVCLISNLVPHNLSRIDNTTLRRLFDLKNV